jgi:hypothetical protein
MDAQRFAFVVLTPAAIVAARFLVTSFGVGCWPRAFALLGFVATLVGCGVAAWVFRRQVSQVAFSRLVFVVLFTAIFPLVAVFPFMPRWPFAGIGFVVAWCIISGGLCGLSLYVAHRVHA